MPILSVSRGFSHGANIAVAFGVALSLSAGIFFWAIHERRRKQQRRQPWAHAVPRKFYPFAPPRGIMNIRLRMDEQTWLDVDRNYCLTMELKMTLLWSCRGEVVASIDNELCGVAGKEALDCILSDLCMQFPGLVKTTDTKIHNLVTGKTFERSVGQDALTVAAQLVQEDLVVMIPRGHTFVLGMGVVCFADRWRLKEKLGLTLAEIHDPVEHYPPIAKAVESFFQNLRHEHGLRIRYNYTFQNCSSLYLPVDCEVEANEQATYMRVERQGLQALPCGAVLFSIRTYLSLVASIPQQFHEPLLEALNGNTKTTLGNDQRHVYADRVQQQLL